MTPRVYYVGVSGVGVEAGGRTLEVRPSREGWRFLRNWREARPSVRDLLSLVHAMALLLMERGEWSPEDTQHNQPRACDNEGRRGM